MKFIRGLWGGLWEPWGSFGVPGDPWWSCWEPLGPRGGHLEAPGGSLGRLLGPFSFDWGHPGLQKSVVESSLVLGFDIDKVPYFLGNFVRTTLKY